MKKVAILIPVFNNLEYTKKCIQRLDELIFHNDFSYTEFLVIVIDDGSTDGTTDWLTAHHPEVIVIRGDGNLWWSGGINMGAKYAMDKLQVDFILLWNNDILPADNYFTELDKLVKDLDERTIAGSKIFYLGRKDLIWSCGGVFNPKTGLKYMVGYNLPDSDEFNRVMDVDWLPGMGTLVPVNIIRNIGYWDAEVFPQYHGDSDFTFRAATAGYQINVYPRLLLWNDKSSSGLAHGGSVKGLVRALTSIRSNTNIGKDILFYRRHATSFLAYGVLVKYYCRVIGGFIKWKLLSLIGVRRDAL